MFYENIRQSAMNCHIIHSLPGRIRISCRRLSCLVDFNNDILQKINSTEGVVESKISNITSNILLYYKSDVVNQNTLLKVVENIISQYATHIFSNRFKKNNSYLIKERNFQNESIFQIIFNLSLSLGLKGLSFLQGVKNSRITKELQRIELDALPLNKNKITANKYKFILQGLNCFDCAEKIENIIEQLDFVDNAKVNFINKILIIDFIRNTDINEAKKRINEYAKSIEPDIKLIECNSSVENSILKSKMSNGKLYFLIGCSIVFGAILILPLPKIVKIPVYLSLYILVGFSVIRKSYKKILSGSLFDENFLMTLATIGAIYIHEYPEAVAVMLFFKIGMYFQEKAVDNSRKSITALMDLKPTFANLKTDKGIVKVHPENVNVSDIIVVKPGEKIPLDGVIIDGKSSVDTKAITGEPTPRKVVSGDSVYSGFINENALLSIKVEKVFSESTVSKILELVENAANKKSSAENLITKFARVYTPIVVSMAGFIAFGVPFLFGAKYIVWASRAMIFLVVSCPCALVISVPLSFFSGIGSASKNGILIKGSNYLEALNDVKTVVFDKTGTLTKGVFNVTSIIPEQNYSIDQLIKYAAIGEQFSNHPIAQSIREYSDNNIDEKLTDNYTEYAGQGVGINYQNEYILCGNKKLMSENNISVFDALEDGTVVYIAVNNKYIGHIIISDELKSDSIQAVKDLKKFGITKTVILSGDNKTVAENTAQKLKIDKVYAELLPGNKVEQIEILKDNQNSKIMYVGDGINDAPVIIRADIGVAMGSLGSDAAIESADIVLMNDELSKLSTAIKIAKRTRKVVNQNITFALSVKIAILSLAVVGKATMWEAVFADVGVSILAILNSVRK
ncbi:MAG TPA: heavy metal translocating P-type ATPase [Victivallales bacterium]|nr:heavy metal translocating P-type ATPase [Victivallales bacterium]